MSFDNYRDALKNTLKNYTVSKLDDLKKNDLTEYKNNVIDSLRNKTGISQVNQLKNINTSGLQNQAIDQIKGYVNGLGFRNQYHRRKKFRGKENKLTGQGFQLSGSGLFGDLGSLGGNLYGAKYGGVGAMAGNQVGSLVGNTLDKLIGTGMKDNFKNSENNNDYIPRDNSKPAFYTIRKSLQGK
jgi:uncharacterized membrane protein